MHYSTIAGALISLACIAGMIVIAMHVQHKLQVLLALVA